MALRDIAIVGWGQTPSVRRAADNEVQLLFSAIDAALDVAGITRRDIQFTVGGSCDYLTGGPFAFVTNLEATGAWPPIAESHVEMDGAWALYEGWARLQHGDLDTALVFGSGKSSVIDPGSLYPQQLDPYYLQPLGVDPVSLAGLQARALLENGDATEADFAAAVVRSRHAALDNPNAQLRGDFDVEVLLQADYVRDPLRRHDLPPVSDGAAAIILAAGDRAREISDHPVWIRGIDHRVDQHQPGMRDLTTSASTQLAASKAGADHARVDVVEMSATFSPQDLILRRALDVGSRTVVNPSGGPLAANPVMSTGLIRFIEVAARLSAGEFHRGLAHATNGQCLQHNLVCVMEGA